MTESGPPVPVDEPFARYPDWLLADTIGDLDTHGDLIAERLKRAKAEMDRRHRLSLSGTRFDVTKSVENERRLNTKGLKAKYGLAWFEGWYNTHKRTKWTITAKPSAEVGDAS